MHHIMAVLKRRRSRGHIPETKPENILVSNIFFFLMDETVKYVGLLISNKYLMLLLLFAMLPRLMGKPEYYVM